MKTIVYYFSGTGNSLKIAKDVAANLDDCELIPIARLLEQEKIISEAEKVGFVFPLYWWGLPKIIYDFVNKIELDKANYIFAIITSGGGKTGGSLAQLNELLNSKSKHINAGFSVKMPDNYIPVYKVVSEEKQKVLFENANEQVKKIAEIIKNNENTENRENIKPIALFVNKKFRNKVNRSDKKFLVDDNCNSCAICAKVCPVNNITIVEDRPVWHNKCQRCLACIHFCPQKAIQYGKKTIKKERYHHPDISVKDFINQKE